MGDMSIPQLAVPPHSVESESSVLGGLLLDNGAWDRVGDLLVDSDFYRYEHRLVFGVCAKLINESKPADVVTVHAELEAQGKADEVGGLDYLNSLAQYVPSSWNIRRYAEIVRERSVLRQIVTASDQARQLAFGLDTPAAQAIEQAMALFSRIEVRHGTREPKRVDALATAFIDRLQDLADGRVAPGISTGIPTIDDCLGGGFKPGRQIVIAARPSVGKSSLALQLAATVATNGAPALVLSQEMSDAELMDRLVAYLGRVDLGAVTTGRLDNYQWPRVTEAIERMRSLPLHIHAESALSLAAIRSLVRRAVRQHGVRVIVLDYLQLCAASNERGASNRHHQIEELSRGLKALAMEQGVTMIVLSQLNRQVEQRATNRPVLADLKESGSIEEDADGVILLSRDGASASGTTLIHAEIAKSRGGRTGFSHLAFEGAVQHWSETTERPEAPYTPARRRHTEDI